MTKEKCLVEKCDRSRNTRGLCYGCYAAAKNLIKLNKTTEAQLMELKMLLPVKEVGGLFREQFNRLTQF